MADVSNEQLIIIFMIKQWHVLIIYACYIHHIISFACATIVLD